jgi:hypothetical protein
MHKRVGEQERWTRQTESEWEREARERERGKRRQEEK